MTNYQTSSQSQPKPQPQSTKPSSKRKWIIAIIIVTITLLIGIAVALGLYFIIIKKASLTIPITKKTELPTEVANSLVGTYLFQQDSDGSKPKAEAKITLFLDGESNAFIIAIQPNETLKDKAEYQIQDQKITISFPDLEMEATNASYEFDGKKLTLPFMVIGEGEGKSSWEKIAYADDPSRDGELYLHHLLSQGEDQDMAVTKTAEWLEKNKEIKKVYVSSDKSSIALEYSDGPREVIFADLGGPASEAVEEKSSSINTSAGVNNFLEKLIQPTYAQFFPEISPLDRESILEQKHQAWLNNEPEPLKLGDAPTYRKALVLSSFYSEFDNTEQPMEITMSLEQAGYQVDGPYTDQDYNFSIKDFVNWMTDKEPYGVFYWATHGGLVNTGSEEILFLFPGIRVGDPQDSRQEKIKKYDRYLEEQFKSIPKNLQGLKDELALNSNGEIIMAADFFQKIPHDYSKSLVYIDACDSTKNRGLISAFNAKAFVGFRKEPSSYITASLANDFFLDLSRKTRTAKEAYDFAYDHTLYQSTKDMQLQRRIAGSLEYYELFQSDDASPQERLAPAVRGMLIQARAYTVRQEQQDLQGTVDSLRDCYAIYWSKGEDGALIAQFCYDASSGTTNLPTKEEVEEAAGILAGYADGRTRFTLIE